MNPTIRNLTLASTIALAMVGLSSPASAILSQAEATCAPGLVFVEGDDNNDLAAPQNDASLVCMTANCQGTSWILQGEYRSGWGAVEFFMDCGWQRLLQCFTIQPGEPCADGPKAGVDGALRCGFHVLWGNPHDILVKCADPVDPTTLIPGVEVL